MSVPASNTAQNAPAKSKEKDETAAVVAAAAPQHDPEDAIFAELNKNLADKKDDIDYLTAIESFKKLHSDSKRLVSRADILTGQRVKQLVDAIIHLINTEPNDYKIYLAMQEFRKKYNSYFNIVDVFNRRILSNSLLHEKVKNINSFYGKLDGEIKLASYTIATTKKRSTHVHEFLHELIYADELTGGRDVNKEVKRILTLPINVLTVLLGFNLENCRFKAKVDISSTRLQSSLRGIPLLSLYKYIDIEACVLLLNADPMANFGDVNGNEYLPFVQMMIIEAEGRRIPFRESLEFIRLLLSRGLHPRDSISYQILALDSHPLYFIRFDALRDLYMHPEAIDFYRYLISSFEINYRLHAEPKPGVPLYDNPENFLGFAVDRAVEAREANSSHRSPYQFLLDDMRFRATFDLEHILAESASVEEKSRVFNETLMQFCATGNVKPRPNPQDEAKERVEDTVLFRANQLSNQMGKPASSEAAANALALQQASVQQISNQPASDQKASRDQSPDNIDKFMKYFYWPVLHNMKRATVTGYCFGVLGISDVLTKDPSNLVHSFLDHPSLPFDEDDNGANTDNKELEDKKRSEEAGQNALAAAAAFSAISSSAAAAISRETPQAVQLQVVNRNPYILPAYKKGILTVQSFQRGVEMGRTVVFSRKTYNTREAQHDLFLALARANPVEQTELFQRVMRLPQG